MKSEYPKRLRRVIGRHFRRRYAGAHGHHSRRTLELAAIQAALEAENRRLEKRWKQYGVF